MRQVALQNLKNQLTLAALAFVTLLLVSPDGYFHDLYTHEDSGWFFMCGKAMMSGMTPYVDFADSKGPLLWLIYGIGYLLSPRNYLGIFWLSCAAYAVTLWYIYRLAALYVTDRNRAMLVPVLMLPVLFYPYIHYEIRCEDFNLMFVAIAMFHVCRLLHSDIEVRHRSRAAIVVGACMGATFLIKYNVTAMLGVPAIYVLVWWWKRRRAVIKPLLMLIGGFAAVVVPVLAALAAMGAFNAFVQEYLINPFTVTSRSIAAMGGIMARLRLFAPTLLPILALSLVGAVLMLWRLPRFRSFPLVTFVTFVALTAMRATWAFHYGTCLIMGVWAVILIAQLLPSVRQWVVITLAVIVIAATTALNWHVAGRAVFYNDGAERADFYRYSFLMRQVEKPKVMYYGIGPMPAFDVTADSRPACRYWASQSGSTPEMDAEQDSVARSRTADFVFAMRNSQQAKNLTQWGYKCYPATSEKKYIVDLYTPLDLTSPPPDLHVTNNDVLLKRVPF